MFCCFFLYDIQLQAFDYLEDLLRSIYGLRVSHFLDLTRVPFYVAKLLTFAEIWLLGKLIYNIDIGVLTKLIPLKVDRDAIRGCLIGGALAIVIVSILFNIEEVKIEWIRSVQEFLVKDTAFIYIISYMLGLSNSRIGMADIGLVDFGRLVSAGPVDLRPDPSDRDKYSNPKSFTRESADGRR